MSVRRHMFQVKGIRRTRPKREFAELVREDMAANNLNKFCSPGTETEKICIANHMLLGIETRF